MIPVAIERIFHAVAITSVLSMSAPVAVAQPIATATDTPAKEIASGSPESEARNGTYPFIRDAQRLNDLDQVSQAVLSACLIDLG